MFSTVLLLIVPKDLVNVNLCVSFTHSLTLLLSHSIVQDHVTTNQAVKLS